MNIKKESLRFDKNFWEKKTRSQVVDACRSRNLITQKKYMPLREMIDILTVYHSSEDKSIEYLQLLKENTLKQYCKWEGVEYSQLPRCVMIQKLARYYKIQTQIQSDNDKIRIYKSPFYFWRTDSLEYGTHDSIRIILSQCKIKTENNDIWCIVETLNSFFELSDHSKEKLICKYRDELYHKCKRLELECNTKTTKRNLIKKITKHYKKKFHNFTDMLINLMYERHDFYLLLKKNILPQVKSIILEEHKNMYFNIHKRIKKNKRLKHICKNEHLTEEFLSHYAMEIDWLIIASKSRNRVSQQFLIEKLGFFDWNLIHQYVDDWNDWFDNPPNMILKCIKYDCGPNFWNHFFLHYCKIYEPVKYKILRNN